MAGVGGGRAGKTSNHNRQNYIGVASTVTSYLYENEDGGLTRVEHINGSNRGKNPDNPYLAPNYTYCGKIVVEDYDSSFRFLSGQEIPVELDIWGGFFAGESFNFFVFGQLNAVRENDMEVTDSYYRILDDNGVTAVEATVNGRAVTWTDTAPFIDANNRTMVSLRAVADAMGLTVDWDAATRTVHNRMTPAFR